ncbi:MAG: hypothetical protein U0893_05510 [Chloroflexota bacterium]
MMTKDELAEVIRSLPDDATIRDAIERLEDIEMDELRAADAAARANGEHLREADRPFRPMTRDQIVERIQSLHKDATVEDAVERLEFIKILEEGIAEADAHPERSIPHEEVMRRLEADEPLVQDQEYDRERPDWAMTREEMAARISDLPSDATLADVLLRLETIRQIERGIAAAEAGQKVSQDEARRRMAQWLA